MSKQWWRGNHKNGSCVSTTILSEMRVSIFNVPESAAHSNIVFKLTVTDDKDDSGTDDVTVEAE